MSKNPPPLNAGGDVIRGGAGVDLWLETLPRFAKASFFCGGCWVCGAGGEVGGAKFRLLKASSEPPKLEVC